MTARLALARWRHVPAMGGQVRGWASTSRRSASTAFAEQSIDTDETPRDGYGMDYGAGPSRLPYEGPVRQAARDSREVEVVSPYVSYSPGSSVASARALRRQLCHVQHGDYIDMSTFTKRVLSPTTDRVKRKYRRPPRPIASLSRLELHVLVHHLLRAGQPLLAAAIMSDAIMSGIAIKPRRRRIFAGLTLEQVVQAVSEYAEPGPSFTPKSGESRTAQQRFALFTPSYDVASSPQAPLSKRSRALSRLLSSMQEVRHHRPQSMYRHLVKQCIDEGRPDVAAKIFVGLVEEWVTEGRVAEGADVDDFCEGGGPNEKLEIQLVSDQMATWWQGVRTWRLPGEVLSPHGRMDLWHPKNLSLGEKMKGFPMPMPTSPPTMVPAPDNKLLIQIIQSLHVDPGKCSPEDYTASMRALAYLANTVLARTLPISSLRSLFQAMAATKHRPAVYPESIDIETVPQSDRWAYESFTQIHLALQSLLSAPPMSASSIRYAEEVEQARQSAPGVPAHPPRPPSQYMLPPLSWTSSLVLLRYGMSRLRAPRLVTNLVVYMKQIFGAGHRDPKAHNIMLEAGIALRDAKLVQMVTKSLFGDLFGGANRSAASPAAPATAASVEIIPAEHTILALDHPDAKLDPEANERSLTTLIVHLSVSSKFDELESLIYDLFPFLATTKNDRIEGSDDVVVQNKPDHLPLSLYPVIIEGLRKAGKTGLAQRVYGLALQAEEDAIARSGSTERSVRNHKPRLPIETFTSMIGVWHNEVQSARNGSTWVKGWKPDSDAVGVRRGPAAGQMAWRTYEYVRERWQQASGGKDEARCRPTTSLVNAVTKACHQRWGLDSLDSSSRKTEQELRLLVGDVESLDFTVPPTIARKLGMEVIEPKNSHDARRKDQGPDPAVALADMMFSEDASREQPRVRADR